jgi:hypothetical protein
VSVCTITNTHTVAPLEPPAAFYLRYRCAALRQTIANAALTQLLAFSVTREIEFIEQYFRVGEIDCDSCCAVMLCIV